MYYMTALGTENGFEYFFHCDIWKKFLSFAFSVFLYDLITNNAGKLEIAETNLIIENIPNSFLVSLSVGLGFFSLSR